MALWPASPIAPFAGGTGTGESAEQTFPVDVGANWLAFAQTNVVQEAPAAAESAACIGIFRGNNFKNTPSELFSNIVSARLEATFSGLTQEAKWYEQNLPTPAGVDIVYLVENIDANAGDTEVTVDVVWSDVSNGNPMNRLFARETSSATAVGAGITISDGLQITDFTVYYVPGGVVVADEEATGRISANSAGIGIQNTSTLSYNVSSIEATSGSQFAAPKRARMALPIIRRTATVTSSIATTSTSTNPDAWGYGFGYIPLAIQPRA